MKKRTPAHPSSPVKKPTHPAPKPHATPVGGSGQPIFSQPVPSPDPAGFKNPVTDTKDVGLKVLGAVPTPAGGVVEPTLMLQQVYGSAGAAKVPARATSPAQATAAAVAHPRSFASVVLPLYEPRSSACASMAPRNDFLDGPINSG